MWGSVFLCAAALLLILAALLLLCPLRLRIQADLTYMGGSARAALGVLFLRLPLHARIYLLQPPAFTVEILNQIGTTRHAVRLLSTGGGDRGKRDCVCACTHAAVRAQWIIGLSGEPAATATLCAAARSLTDGALLWLLSGFRSGERWASVVPVFSESVCRLNLEGMFSAVPAHIMLAMYKKKRREKKYAASH